MALGDDKVITCRVCGWNEAYYINWGRNKIRGSSYPVSTMGKKAEPRGMM